MVYPLTLPENNKLYNAALLIYRQKIISELKKIVQDEVVGNTPNPSKLKKYFAAINYSYMLFTLSKESNDLDFWKERLNYEKIKGCFLDKNIDIDLLIQTISDASN